MINTTRCDLIGVDVDVKDGGMVAWTALEQAHGGPVQAPKVRTGSGGWPRVFSFNKSVAAGLLPNTPTTFTRLQVGADLVGIDLRGNSTPACLVAPPTTYVNGAGATVGYVAVGEGIPHINDLPPLPHFLIDLLHQRVTPPVGGDRGAHGRAHGPERPPSMEPDLASPELQAEVVGELTRLLCGWGDNTSVFSEAVASSVGPGVLYKFRNGPQGDVGGATIIERIYLRKGLKFVFTPNGWFYWNGIIWVADEGGSHILRIMREELVKVEKGYLAERGSNLEARSDEASMESDDESLTDSGTAGTERNGKKKEPKIVNFNFNAKMSNVLTTCKDMFFNAGFEGKLDFNRDFRAAQNGVIDLKTGGF
ncbi:hypothetical protein KFL_010880030 [Klebsormidium nitens]|uniref:Uncharacterized protein n=1 Tax=Klebsormidium nitens TaxID=105231 RepID=A0A1Y1IVE7_KLENI|nr:hypothetical protein KFL_010880030 [Klebsormidium nitens]|eukprot:GAQ92667.1 hypothetical protein KFL_010880030 [Klebsormidium nitens]